MTACLSALYADREAGGFSLVGGPEGMVREFAAMLKGQLAQHTGCVAILISEEAKDYRPEMTWLAARLRAIGLDAYCVEPRHIRFTEEGLRHLVAEMGVSQVVYGTDIPFNWPAGVDLILKAPFLKDAEKEAILGGNLIKLLRITS